jgi:uncharacterized membrane protein (Fun14 family)
LGLSKEPKVIKVIRVILGLMVLILLFLVQKGIKEIVVSLG